MTDARSIVHGFVAPALDGPETGGTIYNARLIAALVQRGVVCRTWTLAEAPLALHQAAGAIWIDSLYLHAVPELRARAGGAPLHLVLHYLPSLVRLGRAPAPSELATVERSALELADAVLVPSAFMQRVVAGLGHAGPVLCIEPGVDAPEPAGAERAAGTGPRALMLCNVTEAKGVFPLLRALAARAAPDDRVELAVAGSLDTEPAYAARCAALISGHPWLARRVRLLGALRHGDALRALRDADLLVSASRMESYGMALAEARALGVPILARRGGHAEAHVEAHAGGELVADDDALAERLLAWTRDPEDLRARQRQAAGHRRVRSWTLAAAEWIDAVETLGLGRGPRAR